MPMRESIEKDKGEFDGWLDKWDAALEKGIFGPSSRVPGTSKSTSDESFFGLRQDNPTDHIDRLDSQYWNAINSVADGGVEMQRLDESDPISINLPNPVRKSTEGKDQDMEPKQLGATFSKEDIEEIAQMKKRLCDLECKAAEMGERDYGSQIKAMIKKIDELSDKLGRDE
jgi:hypothetical protein